MNKEICIKISVALILICSISLNVVLLKKGNEYRRYSIDLRYASVLISDDPSDASVLKNFFNGGDKVISITDTSNSNNSIEMFYHDEKLDSMWWHSVIDKSPFRITLTKAKLR